MNGTTDDAQISYDDFARTLGSQFQTGGPNSGDVPLKLIEVSPRITAAGQEQFALVFHGPSHAFLGQGIQRLHHSELNAHTLFLVPIGQNESGFSYEAVFSRIIVDE